MNTSNLQFGVTFILLRPNGEMLMQQRDDGNGKQIPYPNMWCFPGGGKEVNESYLETTIREIDEEYNLKVKENDCSLLTRYNHDNTPDDHVYICTVPIDCMPKLREGRDMQWKKLSEVKNLSLAWEQHEIIPILAEYLTKNGLS
ncbi:MAG: NUDIX domain-containing protein [Patescibacteria group bacterium]|nr:NUDIX domain-containing protein [Patescibacteria group bacterium]